MEDIQDRAPTNIADYVNQLPSMGIGNSPRTTLMFANATGGANQMSARGLGVTRTLTLLDGRRVVGSGMSPAVDVNLLPQRSEEHTSELQSLMRISYAVFCLNKKTNHH